MRRDIDSLFFTLAIALAFAPHAAATDNPPAREYEVKAGFLDAGGVINFAIEDKKIRFDINTTAANRARLPIRSKLLRLARRVVKHDSVEGQEDEGSETTDNH